MASIKPVIRENKIDKSGEAPLALRVTHNRKSSFIFLGQRLDPKFWDKTKGNIKKSHPNSGR
ncbi:MAG: integrase/recombinase XerD, partial [Parvicella sp.]